MLYTVDVSAGRNDQSRVGESEGVNTCHWQDVAEYMEKNMPNVTQTRMEVFAPVFCPKYAAMSIVDVLIFVKEREARWEKLEVSS